MHIHSLIEKLKELEIKNPNLKCRVYMHGIDTDKDDISLESEQLPMFEFEDNMPDFVMIDFYTDDRRQKEAKCEQGETHNP